MNDLFTYLNLLRNPCLFYITFAFSLAIHPNKLLIATGQATSGQDRKENKVIIQIILVNLITY